MFYVLRKTYNSELIRKAFEESYQWLEICSIDASDIHLASSWKWNDFEDRLIDICTEKIKADYLLTRDERGFAGAHTQVVSPADFFNLLQEEYGLAYDIANVLE